MKKIFLSMIALAAVVAACYNNEETEEIVNTPAYEVLQSMSHQFKNGTSMTIGAVEAKGARSTVADIEYETVTYDISDEQKEALAKTHQQNFPEKQNNLDVNDYSGLENFSYDFLYKSDGEPFTVMLLYTYYCNYRGDVLRLFWLDENGEFSLDNSIVVWEEKAVGEELIAKRHHMVLNETNEAVTVTLPKGTMFGFFFYNSHEVSRHFTKREFNTLYPRDNYGDVYSMVTYTQDGYQVLSIDATFPCTSSYDADMNDIVFIINPPKVVNREVSLDIDIDIDKDLLCEVDDFALSNNLERYPEYYNIGGDTKKRISVSKEEGLRVTVSDFYNLDFDEHSEWTYETWIWLNALPEEEKYLIGSEESPDWDTYSQDNYLIGVSAFQGISGNNDVGYVKVSIHVKKKGNT